MKNKITRNDWIPTPLMIGYLSIMLITISMMILLNDFPEIVAGFCILSAITGFSFYIAYKTSLGIPLIWVINAIIWILISLK